jgi:Mrp family chromosome partitioning ATPase
MSRNFDLMQRAGKAWEVAPAVSPKTETAQPVAGPPQPVQPAPQIVRTEKWASSSMPRGVEDLDQLAREESLRLVQRIFLLHNQQSPRAVVFAGIDHGNGCSRICAQAAEALQAHIQGSVCLVEANLRSKPSAAPKMIPANHYGLTDALISDGPIRSFARPTDRGNLWLLSSGSLAADSHGLLNSDRLKPRFDELRSEFDFVLVDAPPLTRYSDAVALGKVSDGLVLVLEANATRRDATSRVADSLRASNVKILGAVLNKRTFPIPAKLYQRL